MTKAEFTAAVKAVFDACRRLSEISGGIRNFTPDGRMVGDIGEVIAALFYQVELHSEGSHDWDGIYDGRNVQIKATGSKATYLKQPPEGGFGGGLLMVFYIDRKTGEDKLVYNGDIQQVWDALTQKQMNRVGEKTISLEGLRALQKSVRPEDIIPPR
jgi:hypothetical protein